MTIMAKTDFSIGESATNSDDLIAAAKKLKLSHVCICDTMTVSSLIEASKKAKTEGIELVVGVRLRIGATSPMDRENKKQKYYYPKLFAKTEEGMQIIYRLLSLSFTKDRFYYVPRLDQNDLLEAFDPDHLILTTGDLDGLLEHRDVPTKHNLIEKLLLNGRAKNSIYCEFTPLDLPIFDRISNEAFTIAKLYNLQTLAVQPVFYMEGDQDVAAMSYSIAAKHKKMELSYHKNYFPVSLSDFGKTMKGMLTRLEKRYGENDILGLAKQGIVNSHNFHEVATYRWEAKEPSLPQIVDDPEKEITELCKEGWVKRFSGDVFGHTPDRATLKDVYVDRLKYELDTLKAMGFCNYFLLVRKIVLWSKEQGIYVGPGRGSVGGSLVAYLLGITDVDPIRFGLIFERFINPERADLPDIDLDFMTSGREKVVEWVTDTYGEEYVAGIVNYSTLGARSALRDVSRVYNVNQDDVAVSKMIPFDTALEDAAETVPDLKKFSEKYPAVWDSAVKISGLKRGYSQHAAGVIVAGEPLQNRAVIEMRGASKSKGRVINWDKRTAEYQGLIKIDILGLATLDVIRIAIENIKKRHGVAINMLDIPLDDDLTLTAFSQGQTLGIFQFESGGVKSMLRRMAETSTLTFNDIVAANALNRPGPLDAGLVDLYIDGRCGYGVSPIEHVNMRPALEETYNVIVYQEQVMRVARDLCGFSFPDADKIRKAMGKKDQDAMAALKVDFVKGAFDHSGLDKDVASSLWDKIEKFAGYAFNKSHAVEYSMISYVSMWLKQHYSVEFYAGALSIFDDEKLPAIIKEAQDAGIAILPPDVNHSTDNYEVFNDATIAAPLNCIKFVSPRASADIMKVRNEKKFEDIEDFKERTNSRLVNKRVIDVLEKVGALARLDPNALPADHPSRTKHQMVYMPTIVSGDIVADREMPNDQATHDIIEQIMIDCRKVSLATVRPLYGDNPKFMVISDCATTGEEKSNTFAIGYSADYIKTAFSVNGMDMNSAYFTGLVKRSKPKNKSNLTEGLINEFAPFLVRELEALKPPIILALGSEIAKTLVPDMTGGVMENIGRRYYNEGLDAFVIIGFNPSMIYFKPEKQDELNAILKDISNML